MSSHEGHDHGHDGDHVHGDPWKHGGVQVIPGDSARREHRPDAGHEPRGGDQLRPRRRPEDLGRDGAYPRQERRPALTITGELESVIYVLKGKARMRWGERLQYTAEADPGDFIYVPPFVPHQEINALSDETLECVLVRSDKEAVVVNLNIEPAEKPENVPWVDPIHRAPT